ncbi:MAG: hypothetical protein KKB34_17485 [Bacteroidetes bacterium]|nr:hypothetical protein [Bacteroidota bacterium]
MIFRIWFLLLCSYTIIHTQQFGIWKNFSDMKEVKKISIDGDKVWAATSGGVFSYSKSVFENFLTKSEGLSSQSITAIALDDQNRVWLGTDDGIINIYNIKNGLIKKILDINRTENTQKAINDIIIKDGRAYISIDFGLSIIDVNSLQFIESVLKFGNMPSSSKIFSVTIEDKLYVSTENGLAVQKSNITNLSNPDSWNTFLVGQNEGLIAASDIYKSDIYKGNLIVATDQGLFEYSNLKWNKLLARNEAIFDFEIQDEILYVLFPSSLVKYNGVIAETIYENSQIFMNDIVIGDQTNIYIASSNGIIAINSGSVNTLLPNGPITNSFLSISVDENDNIWAATGKDVFGKGFMRFDGSTWTNFNKSAYPSLPTDDFHKVFSYNNRIFACSWGFGFILLEDDSMKLYNATTEGLSGVPWSPNFVVIQDIKLDNNNNIWVFDHLAADSRPLVVFTESGKKHTYQFPFFSMNQDNYIDNGAIDDYGTKWFSIQNRGLFYFSENGTLENETDDVWGYLSQNEYFENRDITSIAVDNRNEIWIGTSLGIKIIPDPARPTGLMLSAFPLRQQSINCIAVDPLNQKWVGTSQGLFHVSSDGSYLLEQYDSKNSPLQSDDIKSIAINENTGTVYIGTTLGLSSLTTTSVKPNADFSKLFCYPNPLIINEGQNTNLNIDGLVQNSSIKILSVDGKLVKEFSSIGGRIDSWNGRNDRGEYVNSGIYIIVAYDVDGTKVESTKVAVIRK